MEKIKEFFKNKAIGYYLAVANIVLALVLAIVFFATYKGAMANNAASLVPETIGIFLIAGAVIEAVVLVLPQYRFIHIGALVMFGLALYKEILLIPNLIADEINNVHYQGGNLGTQVFYLVMLIIIAALSIAAAFIGFYKKEEDSNADFPVKGTAKIVKVGVGAALVLAAVLTSSLVAADMQKKMNMASGDEAFNPVTAEIKKAAEEYDYSFDPSQVLVKEQETYDYNDSLVKSVPTPDHGKYTPWAGHNIVYFFEGAYAEGYQGDYSETYAYLVLYEEGVFGGRIGGTQVKGYWFNSSILEGKNEQGEDIKDCLKMVSNVDHYDSILALEASGFYQYNAYTYLGFSWGTRSIGLGGYLYYPEVALAIDYSVTGLDNFHVGDTFDRDSWKALRILKNLSYSSVFKDSEVKWEIPSGMVDKNNVFLAEGEYEIKASWKNTVLNVTTEASVKINVKPALEA